MWKEFKEFAIRGNVVDMAVGIIIGGAFSRIVQSLVNDIVMPPISLLFGHVDFTNRYINLTSKSYASLAEAQKAGAAVITWGQFLTVLLQFLILSFVIFLLVRQINRLRQLGETPASAPPPATKTCPFCISKIAPAATRCPNCTSQLGDTG